MKGEVAMEIIEWQDSFSVGNDEIDAQHKALFEILNSMACNSSSSVRSDVMADLVRQFEEYAAKHFIFEQDYMKQINYPGCDQQTSQHEYYMKKLSELAGDKFTVPRDMHAFLKTWLINHVLKSDTQIGKHAHQHQLIKNI